MAKPADAPAPSAAASPQEFGEKSGERSGERSGEKLGPRLPLSWHLPVLQLAVITLTLDQFTKYLVRELLAYRASFPDVGFLRFTHTHNTGSAFGILQGQNFPLIFVSFIGIAVLLAIYFSQPRPGNLLRFSLGLMMGGAVGNLVDRLHQGWVTDFIDIGPWPVFNLADASIVTGLALMAWIFLRPSPKGVPDSKAAPANEWVPGPTWCPICDADMVVLADGWRCTYCGVRERIELPQSSNPAIPLTHPAGPPTPEAGPATEPFPASASGTQGASWSSSPDPSLSENPRSESRDPDRPARLSENPATGSSPPGVSQPGLSRPES